MLVTLAAVAGILSLMVSRKGIAVAQDSAIYLGIARNVLHGRGLTSPITLLFTDYFPPLETVRFHGGIPLTTLPPGYSLALALVGAFGVHLDTAARIVGAVSFGISVYLVGHMVSRLTSRAYFVSVGVVLLFVCAGPLSEAGIVPGSWLLLSGFALSEMPFLAISLATLLSLARFLNTSGRRDLIWTGVGIGAAVLCRYLGVALLGTAAVLLFAKTSWPVAARLRHIAALGALGLVPAVVWMALLRVLVGHGQSSTPLRLHPLSTMGITPGLKNVAHWFVPTSVPDSVALLLLALIAASFVTMAVVVRRMPSPSFLTGDAVREPPADSLFIVLALFSVVYILALLGSHLLLNGNITFDIRFIAPVRAVVYVLAGSIAYLFLRQLRSGFAGPAVLAACVLVVLPFSGSVGRLTRDGTVSGLNLPSTTMDAVRRLPRGAVIVSNAPEQVWLRTGRTSVLVPIKHVPESGLANGRFRDDLREVDRLLQQRDSYLVMLGGVYQTGDLLASTIEIQRTIPLELIGEYDNGEIYRRAPAAGSRTLPGKGHRLLSGQG